METGVIKVYGRDWCEDTQQTLLDLQSLGVPYEYINIDKDEKARAWVIEQNEGRITTPTVQIAGEILVEPSVYELGNMIRGTGMRD